MKFREHRGLPMLMVVGVAAGALVSAPGAGSGTATVAVSAPDGGSPITGYRVTCTSSNRGVRVVATAASSPITATGLTIGKSYSCTALVTNLYGNGAVSAASGSFLVS